MGEIEGPFASSDLKDTVGLGSTIPETELGKTMKKAENAADAILSTTSADQSAKPAISRQVQITRLGEPASQLQKTTMEPSLAEELVEEEEPKFPEELVEEEEPEFPEELVGKGEELSGKDVTILPLPLPAEEDLGLEILNPPPSPAEERPVTPETARSATPVSQPLTPRTLESPLPSAPLQRSQSAPAELESITKSSSTTTKKTPGRSATSLGARTKKIGTQILKKGPAPQRASLKPHTVNITFGGPGKAGSRKKV